MKKLSFLLLTVAAFSVILSSCTPKSAVSNKSVFLRLNLSQGSKYTVHRKSIRKITASAAGRNFTSQINMKETVKVKVAKKYNQDSLLLHMNIQHIAFKFSPPKGQTTSYDSDSSKKANNGKFSDYFNKLKNNHFTIKLTPFGKILDIKGLKNLRKAGKNSLPNTNPATKKALNHFLSKKTFKKLFSAGIYRKKPVKEGSQWSNEKQYPARYL